MPHLTFATPTPSHLLSAEQLVDPNPPAVAARQRTRCRRSRLIATLAGLLAAIGTAATGAGHSGVQGAVTLSPSCGGAQREGESCTAPYAGVELRLIDDGGAVAAATRTTATGSFMLPAPAGRYRVQVMTGSKITRCPPIDVVVTAKALSRVDIECDSGMR